MMGILKPLAEFLVRQPIDSTTNAGPTFEYYAFIKGVSKSLQIQTLYNQTLAVWNDDGEAVQRLLNLQAVISKLEDPPKKPKDTVNAKALISAPIYDYDASALDEMLLKNECGEDS